MKKAYVLASLILFAPVTVLGQENERLEASGGVTAGAQAVDAPDSSKFEEYRDVEEGFYLYDLWLDLLDTPTGLFMEFDGENLTRDDEAIRLRLGDDGAGWRFDFDHRDIPHDLSNKAKTPFINQGDGVFTVPSPVPLPTTGGVSGYNLAPSQAQANAGLLTNNDAATATWLSTTLHDTDLGTDRSRNAATLHYSPLAELKFRLSIADEQKDGSKITYGPIGDRPPRTLNIQMSEPVDYETQELKFEAEYNAPTYQALFTYLFSNFDDDIETLRWQNIYARTGADLAAAGGDATFDQWAAHRVGTFGQRALAPDNRYQNASLAFGIDLPLASRLTATAAYGMMRQDETLLPYSTSDFNSTTVDFASTAALPRQEADGEIDTLLLNVDYTINPIERLNLRPFFRYYDLENDSPEDNWWYITSDTIPGALGAAVTNPTFKNQRVNLAYGFDQMNFGLDTSYSLGVWRTTLGLGYEREEIERDHREADTDENIFTGSVKATPLDWLTLRAKYLYGDREGDDYNTDVTAASYWYDTTIRRDNDNPAVSFTNHPDMRKYDVSDRERNQVDLAATVMPVEGVDLTGSYLFREDDFDSGVTSIQPLLDVPLAVFPATATAADQQAATPGDQLGLLERETQRYALDASYAPTRRLTLTAFGSRETIESEQRNLEFDENDKLNPISSGIVNSELGPWTRESSQWVAETEDKTNTVGVGAGYELIPDTLRLFSDYTVSRGKVDIEYSGYGTVFVTDQHGTAGSPTPDEYQFAFRSPETVRHNQYILNASLEYQLVKNVVLGFHYIFDRYKISDWMQEPSGFWVEQVGSEYFLRDTTAVTASQPGNSTQWGNRLVRLGSTLAPTYEAHVGSLTMTYRF